MLTALSIPTLTPGKTGATVIPPPPGTTMVTANPPPMLPPS